MTSHTFTVRGAGSFPLDMLRYDTCWPASGSDTYEVLHAVTGVRLTGEDRTRNIRLTGNKAPTLRRWHSYGWDVIS